MVDVERADSVTDLIMGENRIYYEPRCHEGNYGLGALLRGARAAEQAFTEGRGPVPKPAAGTLTELEG